MTKAELDRMLDLSENHSQWFVEMVKPLLQTYMEHGYRHGFEDGQASAFSPTGRPKCVECGSVWIDHKSTCKYYHENRMCKD